MMGWADFSVKQYNLQQSNGKLQLFSQVVLWLGTMCLTTFLL